MDWKSKISLEFSRIRKNDNPGKVRTTARRIVGIALEQLYTSPGNDFIKLLHRASDDRSLPESVQNAAGRLGARLTPDFQSPSSDPLGDAKIIVDYVQKHTS